MRTMLWLWPLLFLWACGGQEVDGPSSGACLEKAPPCTGEACIGEAWSAGAFGDPCQLGQECVSGICGQDSQTGDMFCTQTCDPQSAEPCPYGASCLLTGDATTNVCGPPISC